MQTRKSRLEFLALISGRISSKGTFQCLHSYLDPFVIKFALIFGPYRYEVCTHKWIIPIERAFIIRSFEKISAFKIRIKIQSILILNKFILNINQLIMINLFPKNNDSYTVKPSILRGRRFSVGETMTHIKCRSTLSNERHCFNDNFVLICGAGD